MARALERREQPIKWLNTFEVAERHEVSAWWVRHVLRREPGVVVRKHGNAWWFTVESVDVYFLRKAQESKAQ